MSLKCLASMEGIRSEIDSQCTNGSGWIIYNSKILTQNFCSNQSRNPNHNQQSAPKCENRVNDTYVPLLFALVFKTQIDH